MASPKLTLVYFPLGGRAEAIRLCAAIGKVKFTNKSVKGPEFQAMKESLPTGQLPVLEIEGEGSEKVVVPESISILRYFGKLGGLYPEDPTTALKVDSMMYLLGEAQKPIETSMSAVRALVSETEFTEEEKMAMRKRFLEKTFPHIYGIVEKMLKESESGWLVGDKVTIADVLLYYTGSFLTSGILDGIPKTLFDTSYPCIKAHAAKLGALPEVVAWNEKYPKPYGTFDFEP